MKTDYFALETCVASPPHWSKSKCCQERGQIADLLTFKWHLYDTRSEHFEACSNFLITVLFVHTTAQQRQRGTKIAPKSRQNQDRMHILHTGIHTKHFINSLHFFGHLEMKNMSPEWPQNSPELESCQSTELEERGNNDRLGQA